MTTRLLDRPRQSQLRLSRPRQLTFMIFRNLPLVILLMTSILMFQNIRTLVRIRNPLDAQPATSMHEKDATTGVFVDEFNKITDPLNFFPTLLPTIGVRPLNSDVVELRHCRLDHVNYTRYAAWANAILVGAWSTFESKLKSNTHDIANLSVTVWNERMMREFALELLEVFATNEGHCDFSKYPLQIAYNLSSAASVLRAVSLNHHSRLPRLAIVIIAFQDAPQLANLVKALHMPHHYIIIHLERSTPQEYSTDVHKIASLYTNVAVVQFGTVTYTTDSVSMINYQIMNWLVNDLKLSYDFHSTMDGGVYPLYNATSLCRRLANASRDVWLGELLQNGKKVNGVGQWAHMLKKRLIYTAGTQKYYQRFKNVNQNEFVSSIPRFLESSMTNKTNSGNQAVFSFKFVQELTNVPKIKHLFAIAKYSCCCCSEERTWVAAARILGYGEQALKGASMFQAWGGHERCESSMKNSVLQLDAERCYKIEDATTPYPAQKPGEPMYIRGYELVDALKLARSGGILFARKFNSEIPSSMELLRLIQREFHQN